MGKLEAVERFRSLENALLQDIILSFCNLYYNFLNILDIKAYFLAFFFFFSSDFWSINDGWRLCQGIIISFLSKLNIWFILMYFI